jgi:hypothetical protein
MKPRYHGSECFCDTCSQARNARAHKYVALTNQGKRYGESDDTYRLRLDRVCNAVEKAAKIKS